jgi:2-succinyl-5-enolpyruvyl-6-hydroxy-3-cyclohexene-1-carboxylate synthase
MSVPTGTPVPDATPPPGRGPAGTGDVQAAFAATLVDEWARHGIIHAVVCPGSRSTPLAVALADHPGLRVHVRLDERSAAFTALGIGLATGRPAVVVTTSGTAAAELHPAVVEADLSGVPLLACTADRPPELRDVGAPQTIDQTHLFGHAPRWFADPGVPDPRGRPTWRSLASRAVAEAVSGAAGPGPVHLNLPFREPLLGDPSAGGLPPGRPDGSPWHQVETTPPGPWSEGSVVDQALVPGRRGVVVAGAGCGDPEAVIALAAALGWPVLADPRSGLRTPSPWVVAAADGLLRAPAFAKAHRPEVVLRLGERWVSKVVNSVLAEAVTAGSPDIVVGRPGRWVDPERSAAAFVRSDPTLLCRRVTARWAVPAQAVPAPGVPAPGSWAASWAGAELRAREALQRSVGRTTALTEPALAHRLVGTLPAGVTLVVSSSMPVRDVEAFGAPREGHPRVLSNRGANGIDGVVSTALGVALATGGPTVALVGDLAFLHDVSALVGPAAQEADLTVVVADNGGGGIFSFLPPASALAGPAFETLFGTPQQPDVAEVAAGFGWRVDDLGPDSTAADLDEALGRRVGDGGCSVIRVVLPGRPENVAEHDRINAAMAEAVDGG